MTTSCPIASDEEKRLQVIEDLHILQLYQDDEIFQRITILASEYYKCSVSVITVVRQNTVWFLAKTGFEGQEVERECSFCSYAILPESAQLFIVPNAIEDDRYKHFPLVAGPPYFRFYAASPIYLQGVRVGTLSIFDPTPRPDFDEEKGKKLNELTKIIADIILQKKIEFAEQENLTMEILQNITKEIISILQTMIRTQNELLHLHRLLYPNMKGKAKSMSKIVLNPEEIEESLEKSKHELLEKRLFIQSTLQKGLLSVDNLKKTATATAFTNHQKKSKKNNSRRSHNGSALLAQPYYSFFHGDYLPIEQWYSKLKEIVIKTVPNYGMYANHIKWEFRLPITEAGKGFEMNEGNLSYLSTLMSLLIICHLQKWKYIQLSFCLFPEKDLAAASNRTSYRPLPKHGLTVSSDEYDEPEPEGPPFRPDTLITENAFSLLNGKLCVEMKGYGRLASASAPSSTTSPSSSSPAENYPLFPEENQFFSICDNFIASSFQIIPGEYQKYNNRTEDITNFWIASFLKEVKLLPENSPTGNTTNSGNSNKGTSSTATTPSKKRGGSFIARFNRAGTFFNSSINNFLNNDWFNRNTNHNNNSRRETMTKSNSVADGLLNKTPSNKNSARSLTNKYSVDFQLNEENMNEANDEDPEQRNLQLGRLLLNEGTEETQTYQFQQLDIDIANQDKLPANPSSRKSSGYNTRASMGSVVQFFFPSKSNKVHVSLEE